MFSTAALKSRLQSKALLVMKPDDAACLLFLH